MNFFKLNKIITIFLFLIWILPTSFIEASSLDTGITANMKPEFPRANQTVSISLESYLTDLNRAEIYWYKNGILERGGLGETGFSFDTKEVGSEENISIEIVSPNLGIMNKEIIVRPAEIDLVWEADSYTPPFYKGKSLNSKQSDVTVVAVPNLIKESGEKISSENLIYTWRKDWSVLGSKSGVGKNKLLLESRDMLRDPVIVVDVETLDGLIKARRTITINKYQPKILFYKKDALLGTLFNTSISKQFNLSEEEISVVVYPFFFSEKDFSQGNLQYNWSMNNKRINNDSDTLVLRQEGESAGMSILSLEIKNLNKIMQFSEEKFNILFGKEQGSLFGN
ncbi:hypothetical protein KKC45_01570 [Patescibacteria group bacterium]|nr:hypothetical protein [Patescibacteria group bacterium]